jgi:propanediol dehydratase small subunit
MPNKHLENQISRQDNLERIEETLKKQSNVAGEKRDDKLVHNFPQAASLAQTLKDIEFPTDKKTIIRFIEEHRRGNPEIGEIWTLIEKIPNQRQYYNVFEIAEAAKLVDSSSS